MLVSIFACDTMRTFYGIPLVAILVNFVLDGRWIPGVNIGHDV